MRYPSIMILLSVVLSLSACDGSMSFTAVDSIPCETPQQPPVKTQQAAICYAIQSGNVAARLKEAQKQNEYITGWEVKTFQENAGEWQVDIRSVGTIPSFSCGKMFNEAGLDVKSTNAYVKTHCGWNK